METSAQIQRLSHWGRKHHLSEDQEREIVQWISQRGIEGKSTSGKDIISFISQLTSSSFIPRKDYISRLCKRLGIVSKTQKKKMEKQMRPTINNEIQEFQNMIHSLQIKPSE